MLHPKRRVHGLKAAAAAAAVAAAVVSRLCSPASQSGIAASDLVVALSLLLRQPHPWPPWAVLVCLAPAPPPA